MPPKRTGSKSSSLSKRSRRGSRRSAGLFIRKLTTSGDDEDDLNYVASDDSEDEQVNKPVRGKTYDYYEINDDDDNVPLAKRAHGNRRIIPRQAEPLPSQVNEISNRNLQHGKCMIQHMPQEILDMIIFYILPPDLLLPGDKKQRNREVMEYCYVSRQFRALFQPILFEDLNVEQIRPLYALAKLFTHSPGLKSYVKEISIHVQSSVTEEANMVARALESTIGRCTNLQCLTLRLTAPMGFQIICPTLSSTFLVPSLRKFSLIAKILSSLSFMNIFFAFPNLDDVQLCEIDFSKLQYNGEMFGHHLSKIKNISIYHCKLSRCLAATLGSNFKGLQSVFLYLIGNGPYFQLLEELHQNCPKLSMLHLDGFIKDEPAIPTKMWTTLTKIELHLRRHSFDVKQCYPKFGSNGITDLRNLKFLRVMETPNNLTVEQAQNLLQTVKELAEVINSHADDQGIYKNNVQHVSFIVKPERKAVIENLKLLGDFDRANGALLISTGDKFTTDSAKVRLNLNFYNGLANQVGNS
ncbi:hypothetical protein V1514DRAFT_356897 [Lipomyces japonicus]|uniref:uncharacterized protein n=1 Tax=Lipomyces japonicus TaxID=56871 RepID=UPI0034CF6E28